MKKETQVEGLMKTTFINEELDEKIGIKQELNVDSHLKTNKELYNQNDGYSPSKGFKRVASIPTLALEIWAKEYNGTNNFLRLPKEVQNKILKEKLNSNEYRYFRTAPGRL
jgi:hypothetical protein